MSSSATGEGGDLGVYQRGGRSPILVFTRAPPPLVCTRQLCSRHNFSLMQQGAAVVQGTRNLSCAGAGKGGAGTCFSPASTSLITASISCNEVGVGMAWMACDGRRMQGQMQERHAHNCGGVDTPVAMEETRHLCPDQGTSAGGRGTSKSSLRRVASLFCCAGAGIPCMGMQA